jgi:hypothetical protein
LFRQLGAACRVNDPVRCQALLLEWAALQFENDPPGSLGALAARLSGPLAAEIEALEAVLYGPDASEWQGRAMLAALKQTQTVSLSGTKQGQDPLVPLYR